MTVYVVESHDWSTEVFSTREKAEAWAKKEKIVYYSVCPRVIDEKAVPESEGLPLWKRD